MTIRDLRAQHKHAVKMLRVTSGDRGWARAVARLNYEIMRRARPPRTAATVAAKEERDHIARAPQS